MRRTRNYSDFEERRTRSFLVKVCDYGVAILLLIGVGYSTYLDIEARFKPSEHALLAAQRAEINAKSTIK
ncbi:hypothetical protein [Phyllobacterium bourgognense]|uniref:Uncharacterized protein n=1 Tax=Phyllobacterium bourgognense TaxID=314236 RepID=A0A368YYM6_9HYPH|nr:hypothetical protein [Phyllobacterium bourgognense]RCW85310.1 hypothetical protein C7476_103152 [Phyllobacterium bourgognense]